jgi:protein-S-isoprenylcysteine O-methyltransferase Ste14
MYTYLIPLLIGFTFNAASAFTTSYSRHLGERGGRVVCIILRDILGIPVWVVGYALAVLSLSSLLFTRTLVSSVMAWFLLLSGVAIILAGRVSIRWRAVAPSTRDTLVTYGLYAHIRHPIYSGLILELIGLFLWLPTVNVLIACLLGLTWVLIQAGLEEMDLVERLPEYKDYMQRVPRFIPRLR